MTGGAALDAFLALARYADGQYQHIVDHMRSSTYDAKQALMRRAKRDAEQLTGDKANRSAPPPPSYPAPPPPHTPHTPPLTQRTPHPPHTPHPPPLTGQHPLPLLHRTPTPHPRHITPPDPARDPHPPHPHPSPTLHHAPRPRTRPYPPPLTSAPLGLLQSVRPSSRQAADD